MSTRFKGSVLGLLLALCVIGCDDGMSSCFVAGTLITTPHGTTPIEQLVPGDSVVAVDPVTGTFSVSIVTEIRTSTVSSYLLVTSDRASVGVTETHPFANGGDKHFTPIGELRLGSTLWSVVGGCTTPTSLVRVERRSEPVTVYDLVTDRKPHSFIAGSFLVHNKSPVLPNVTVVVKSEPPTAGWVKWDNTLYGQGADTTLKPPQGTLLTLEAQPKVGWRFVRWEGDVTSYDSTVTSVQADYDAYVVCVFDTLRWRRISMLPVIRKAEP